MIYRLGISKDELAKMLDVSTRKDVCLRLGVSERTLDRAIRESKLTRENYGPNKITEKEASQIRLLYQTGCKQDSLAKTFQITQSMVSKIVNNESHRVKPSFNISGQAEVRLG